MVDRVSLLPPLREIIDAAGLDARKSLGQHFLLDLNLTSRIARYVPHLDKGTTIEVGPGPGGLTRALLMAGATKVVAVERDSRAVAVLASLIDAAEGRLEVVDGDAMHFDYAAFPEPRRIVSNLPYNIGTPLLIGWIEHIDLFQSLTLMFQKEVAERLFAEPRTSQYGRLSIMTQWRCQVSRVLDLPARAFTPPPKVDSTVVQLFPHHEAPTVDWRAMEVVVAAAFGQRRKMLRGSLKSLGNAEELLAAAHIEPTARAEELSVADFVRLATLWRAAHPVKPQ